MRILVEYLYSIALGRASVHFWRKSVEIWTIPMVISYTWKWHTHALMPLHIILPLMLDNECRVNSLKVRVTALTSGHYGTHRTSRAEMGWKLFHHFHKHSWSPPILYPQTVFWHRDTPTYFPCFMIEAWDTPRMKLFEPYFVSVA